MSLKMQKILNNTELSEIEKLKQIDELNSNTYYKRKKPTNLQPKKKKRKK
jgi:hypothetical protein